MTVVCKSRSLSEKMNVHHARYEVDGLQIIVILITMPTYRIYQLYYNDRITFVLSQGGTFKFYRGMNEEVPPQCRDLMNHILKHEER